MVSSASLPTSLRGGVEREGNSPQRRGKTRGKRDAETRGEGKRKPESQYVDEFQPSLQDLVIL